MALYGGGLAFFGLVADELVDECRNGGDACCTQYPYLVDRHAAGIVLVVSLGEDQLGGNVVAAGAVRAGGCGRRREIVALEVNGRECLLQGVRGTRWRVEPGS